MQITNIMLMDKIRVFCFIAAAAAESRTEKRDEKARATGHGFRQQKKKLFKIDRKKLT